jgi:hypothetical protein
VWLTKVINERGIQKLYMTHKTREAWLISSPSFL